MRTGLAKVRITVVMNSDPIKILIVDDEPNVRLMYHSSLESEKG